MPFRNDPAELLNDILTDIANIEQFTQGADEASFERNDQVAYAVKYALLRISEAAHRLGDRAPELCPEVPWRRRPGPGEPPASRLRQHQLPPHLAHCRKGPHTAQGRSPGRASEIHGMPKAAIGQP